MYEKIKQTIASKGLITPLSAENEEREYQIIEEGKDGCGHFYQITTAQNNDWCRVYRYYEDGTTTETFEK